MLTPKITNVQVMGDYKLSIHFINGESGILNMQPYLDFGVFYRLRDPVKFSAVHICFDTLEWDCGVDLDPDFVYEKSVKYDEMKNF